MLLHVLPEDQSARYVNVERAYQPSLRDLHAVVHQADQLDGYPGPLVAEQQHREVSIGFEFGIMIFLWFLICPTACIDMEDHHSWWCLRLFVAGVAQQPP